MALPPVRRLAMRHHCTGIGSDVQRARELLAFYESVAPVAARRILELGPGQTLEVLKLAARRAAACCTALDVAPYADAAEARAAGVDYRLYDGRRFPFADASFDLLWAWDVLEHLRRPEQTLREIRRVLAAGGTLICRADLRDHYHLADPARWLACRRYSRFLWNAMTWYRSSHVNRLVFSQWRAAFDRAGLANCQYRPETEPRLAQSHRPAHLASLDEADLTTWRFVAICRV